MKISLKKANLVQQKLAEATRTTPKLALHVSLYSASVGDDVEAAKTELNEYCIRQEKLVNALYDLRDLIQKANNVSGVSAALNKIARNQRIVDMYVQLANVTPGQPLAEVLAQIAAMNAAETKQYSTNQRVVLNILNKAEVLLCDTKLKSLLLTDSQLREELLELNVTSKIELDENLVSVLKDEMIM